MKGRKNLSRPRDSILDVATTLFSQTGYAGTTIRDIASTVGVLPGSIYAHIDNKETLLLEIVETGIDQFLDAAEAIDHTQSPTWRLRAAIKTHVRVVAENPQRTLVVFHQWRYLTGPNRARIVDKRQRYEDVYRSIMEEGIATGEFGARLDAKVAVLGILGALNWTAEWLKPDGPSSAENVGDRLADAQLWGVLRN